MQVGAEADSGAGSGLSAGRFLWRKGRPAESRVQVAGNRLEARPRRGHGGRTGKAPLPGGQGAWPASHQMQQLAQGLSKLLRLSLSPCCCSQVSGTHDFEQTHTTHTPPSQRRGPAGTCDTLREAHLRVHTADSRGATCRHTPQAQLCKSRFWKVHAGSFGSAQDEGETASRASDMCCRHRLWVTRRSKQEGRERVLQGTRGTRLSPVCPTPGHCMPVPRAPPDRPWAKADSCLGTSGGCDRPRRRCHSHRARDCHRGSMRVLGVLSGKPVFINIKIPCLQIHMTVFAVLITLKSVLFSL